MRWIICFFVHDAQVSALQEFAKTGCLRLHVVMALVNGAEEEEPQPARAAKFKKLARMGQGRDGGLRLPERSCEIQISNCAIGMSGRWRS